MIGPAPRPSETGPVPSTPASRPAPRTPEIGPIRKAGRLYLLPMLLLVLLATGLAAWAFARAPLPPGVDPGHWLSASYPYVGLPTAPDPADQMFFYSPLLFPFLGGLVVLTGNPALAADLTGIGLFLAYGLSVIYLARRFLFQGSLQVALVGLSVFSGATLQMLFWGGYPNLFGFALMNIALVFLLRFVRSGENLDALGFYATLVTTYFAHDLSFAVLFVAVATAGIFLLLLHRVPMRFLWRPANLLGIAATVGLIGGYTVLTAHSGIAHPSYFASNPASYRIDQVGEIFSPLAHGPYLFPPGAPIYLPAVPTALALAAAPLVALFALAAFRNFYPRRVDTRLVIAVGWLAASLAVPGIGYLAGVQTDYTRFLYFVPLPLTLVALLGLERALLPALAPVPSDPVGAAAEHPGSRDRPAARPGSGVTWVLAMSVTLLLLLVFPIVTVPTVLDNEASGTSSAHDAQFLQAMGWLRADPGAGNVLTVPSAARWTEALTNREAFTVGPVWLLFDPFQITDAQEAYWALTSTSVVTNNVVALGFSGLSTPVMSEGPIFTAYDSGVPFPVLRILSGSLSLNVTNANGTDTRPVAPVLAGLSGPPASPPEDIVVQYDAPSAVVMESMTTLPDGSAEVIYHVIPGAGDRVNAVDLTFAPPPMDSTTLGTDSIRSLSVSSAGISTSVSGKLGQLPTPVSVGSRISFSAPMTLTGPSGLSAGSWPVRVADPNGTRPFELALHFVVAGAPSASASLPAFFNTTQFLEQSQIRYLLWPEISGAATEIAYYEATFGYRLLDQNQEWALLGA